MIRQDTFPATIVLASSETSTPASELTSAPPTPGVAYLNTVRVVLTHDRIMVAKDDPSGPQVVFSQPIDPASHVRKSDASGQDSYVTTLSGTKVAWRKDNGCGCGSRLRTWRPYKNVGSIADPGPEG